MNNPRKITWKGEVGVIKTHCPLCESECTKDQYNFVLSELYKFSKDPENYKVKTYGENKNEL